MTVRIVDGTFTEPGEPKIVAPTATRPDLTTNNIVVRGKQIFSRVIYVGLKVVRCAPLVFGRVRELE